MYDARFPNPNRRPAPRDQFRCAGCQRFVRGTEHGVCPRCGLSPPSFTRIGAGGRALRQQVRPSGVVTRGRLVAAIPVGVCAAVVWLLFLGS